MRKRRVMWTVGLAARAATIWRESSQRGVTMTQSLERVRTVALPSGETVPTLGQGTWGMGEDVNARAQEIEALREGLDLGMTLIER